MQESVHAAEDFEFQPDEPECSLEAADSGSLRIGLFSESFHPVQNGVTTSVLTLVAGLRTVGHRVWIFAPEHERQTGPETNVMRFPSFVSAFNREYPLAYPFFPRLALATHFNRLRLDIVHTHTPFVLGLTGANLALSREIPLVSTFHTLYSQYSHYLPLLPDNVTQGLLDTYLPWYYNRCDQIICPSQVAAEELRQFGVESAIEIIPTGIPLPAPGLLSEETRRATREKLGVGDDIPLLLYAGRLAAEKNVGWLLQIFGVIRQSEPRAVLALAGGGPQREELRAEAAAMGAAESVLFLGPTPRARMDALYAAADVFCFPSPSETQGLVIGEARAAGLPCVAVDAGGAAENVRDGEDGFRVPPDDPALFAARVLQILREPRLRDSLRANALRNAREFTPERMVIRVREVYTRAREQSTPTGRFRARFLPEDIDWEEIGQSIRENPGGFFKSMKK